MMDLIRIKGSAITIINRMFFLLAVVTLVFSMYNYLMYRGIGIRYQRSTDLYYEAMAMKESIKQCDMAMADYLVSRDRVYLADHNESVKTMEQTIKNCWKLVDTSAAASFMQSVSDAFDSYQTVANYGAFSYAEENYYAGSLSFQESREIGNYIQEYCDEILRVQLEKNRDYYVWLNQKQGQLFFINLYAVILLVVAALNKMSRSIVQMLADIQKNTEIKAELLAEQLKNEQYVHRLEQADFLNLQLQTNPHFLFNTLNTISRTITLGMNEEAVEMIDSMAAMLRYNLNDLGEPVTLAEELEVVREYLHIQSFRFRDRIQGDYEDQEELAGRVRVPRFSLQPFVENAVIHGLEPRTVPGWVRITVRERGGKCIIKIKDNGVGIPAGKLQDINEGRQIASGKRKSVGVNNTMERLRFFTKDPECVRLESVLGEGTVVTICLPMEGETCTS